MTSSTAASPPTHALLDYEYNAEGILIAKTKNNNREEYHIDGNNPTGYAQVVETFFDTGSGLELTATHHYGHDLVSVHQNNGSTWQRHFYLYDGLGSVRALADEIGTVTDTYTYDAFGNLLHTTGSTANPYRYTGERYDADLGMYYLRARYMNTETGRFWTMDSYEGRNSDPNTLHKYLYANANPVMYVDPSGMYNMAGTIATTGVIGNITGIAKLATGVLIAAISSVIVKDFDKASDAIKEIARKLRRSICSAIIGESMERVLYAKAHRYIISEIFPLESDLSGILLMEWNRAWIRGIMRRKCVIIDIGLDPTRIKRGPFYQMELKETSNYFNKVYDLTIPGFRNEK